MATSGTFTGSRGGNQYGPWLTLSWSRIQEDIPNNRSLLRLTLKLHADSPYGNIRFSASKTGNLEGQSFTYTGGMSGNGTVTLKTRDMWVNHNSDGSKSITLNASFNIAVTWSGSYLGSISVSGTAHITDIPRASDFTAFTLSNSTLNTNTATTINYTLGRKSTAFSQAMTLKYGSKVIASWTTSGTGSLTRTLSSTEVNNIIKAMSNTATGTLTLTMQTKSGSKNIGSAKSIKEGISLNSAIKPNASGLSVSISGTGRDKTLGKYIQGISRVLASFSRSAGYGASISSNTITVKRSDGKDSQTIPSYNGGTANPVQLSGTYTITGTVKDSRGRTDTVSTNITVHAYSPPKITEFTAARRVSPTSTVDAKVVASWSPLGTDNPATVNIVRKDRAGTTTTLYTLSSSTAGSLSTTRVFTSQSDALSFDYILTVEDSFGNTAPSTQTVGSSFVELSVARGKGIGVGKVHERGSLDVSGDAYMYGFVEIEGRDGTGGRSDDGALRIHGDGKVMKLDYTGHGYVEFTKDNVREGYIGFGSDTHSYISINNQRNDTNGYVLVGDQKLSMTTSTAYYNGKPVFTSDHPRLWEGALYMQDGHNVTPSKKLSECPNGWVLAWSYYSGGAQNVNWNFTLVPKDYAFFSGGGSWHTLRVNRTELVSKYIYCTDSEVRGHDGNRLSPDNKMVLRYVFAY